MHPRDLVLSAALALAALAPAACAEGAGDPGGSRADPDASDEAVTEASPGSDAKDALAEPPVYACPTDGCLTTVGPGAGCLAGSIVGRFEASGATGLVLHGDTCKAHDAYHPTACPGPGLDDSYRIFVHKGETVDVSVAPGARCADAGAGSWEPKLVVAEAGTCGVPQCTTMAICSTQGAPQGSYTAKDDGWVAIVIDSFAATAAGAYDLTVRLSGCLEIDCGC